MKHVILHSVVCESSPDTMILEQRSEESEGASSRVSECGQQPLGWSPMTSTPPCSCPVQVPSLECDLLSPFYRTEYSRHEMITFKLRLQKDYDF